jgi:hypothetical protein
MIDSVPKVRAEKCGPRRPVPVNNCKAALSATLCPSNSVGIVAQRSPPYIDARQKIRLHYGLPESMNSNDLK